MRNAGGLLSAAILAVLVNPDPLRAQTGEESAVSDEMNALIETYCTECHNFTDYSGGLDLEGLSPHNVADMADVGEKVIRRLRAGMMPPAGQPRPDTDTLQRFSALLEQSIDAQAEVRPGRPGMHRLNRVEYQNAIRDLLGLSINASDFLPADDASRGFDNQAGTLTLSPALLEAYLSTAMKVSRLALGLADSPTQHLYRAAEDANQNYRLEGLPFGTRGGLHFQHYFPVDAQYQLKIYPITLGNMGNDRPFGTVRGEQLQVLVNGEQVKVFDWDEAFSQRGDGSQRPTLDLSLSLPAGEHSIGVTFTATNYAPGLDMNNDFELSTIETGGLPGFTWYPHVGSVRVDGPYEAAGPGVTASREAIFSCYPRHADEERDCAVAIFSQLSRLALRGKQRASTLDTLMQFYEQGHARGGFEEGIAMGLQRLLVDPGFIYRIEDEPDTVAVGDTYPVSDLDLASRLSFFLWSSLPDDTLLSLAEQGRLSQPEVLGEQLQRLLADPRSAAFTRNFAGQWLALRNLPAHVPVVHDFPDFDDLLRQSFQQETELLFDHLVRENRPLSELLNADYTFVNERLALHYGIPGIRGERFRRVHLNDELSLRRGILGNGSMLMVSSQPGRTSPVMRGYWVLSNLIGVEPPPPPPDVPELETPDTDVAGNQAVPSLRQQLEAHRSNPGCMGCHQLMDPIGFALENFDAVGTFRVTDNGVPVDTRDTFYDGREINDVLDLQQALLVYKESLARNVTQRLLTYALGRGMDDEDMPLVRQVQHQAREQDYRLQAMIEAVVNSTVFLTNEKQPGERQPPAQLSASGG